MGNCCCAKQKKGEKGTKAADGGPVRVVAGTSDGTAGGVAVVAATMTATPVAGGGDVQLQAMAASPDRSVAEADSSFGSRDAQHLSASATADPNYSAASQPASFDPSQTSQPQPYRKAPPVGGVPVIFSKKEVQQLIQKRQTKASVRESSIDFHSPVSGDDSAVDNGSVVVGGRVANHPGADHSPPSAELQHDAGGSRFEAHLSSRPHELTAVSVANDEPTSDSEDLSPDPAFNYEPFKPVVEDDFAEVIATDQYSEPELDVHVTVGHLNSPPGRLADSDGPNNEAARDYVANSSDMKAAHDPHMSDHLHMQRKVGKELILNQKIGRDVLKERQKSEFAREMDRREERRWRQEGNEEWRDMDDTLKQKMRQRRSFIEQLIMEQDGPSTDTADAAEVPRVNGKRAAPVAPPMASEATASAAHPAAPQSASSARVMSMSATGPSVFTVSRRASADASRIQHPSNPAAHSDRRVKSYAGATLQLDLDDVDLSVTENAESQKMVVTEDCVSVITNYKDGSVNVHIEDRHSPVDIGTPLATPQRALHVL